MTPTVKCKSFKTRDAGELDQLINDYLEKEKVTEIVHVSSSGITGTTLNAVTIFYRCEVKTTRKPKKKPEPIEAKADAKVETKKETNNKDVSNG